MTAQSNAPLIPDRYKMFYSQNPELVTREIVEALGAAESRLAADERMRDALEKCMKGHWEAKTYNSHRRDCCSQWGNFATKEEAEKVAQAEANTHNDTASAGYAVFECDFDAEELMELARAALSAPGMEVEG